MDKSVQEIMTPEPVAVFADQTIADAARVMREAQIGAVLVVNGETLAGLITDRDLVVRGLAEGLGPDAPVGPLCSSRLVAVAAGANLAEAEVLFRENAVRRLPVVAEGGEVVGILSLGDLAVAGDGDSPLAAVSQAKPSS